MSAADVFPEVSPDLYARNAKEDGRQLTRIGNPTELGQRQLAVALRIEDQNVEIIALLASINARLGIPAGEPAMLVTGEDTSTPLLVEIRDLLAAGAKPAKAPRGSKADTASEG